MRPGRAPSPQAPKESATKTLVLGIGNPLRGDDAAGWILAERIAALGLPDVEVRMLPQLQVELVADWAQCDRVIVLDAAVGTDAVRLEELEAEAEAGPHTTSHDLAPATLLALVRRLHERPPHLFLCSIPGTQFNLGTALSSATARHLDGALTAVRALLNAEDPAGSR